jgi:hypothetical protein
MLREEEDQLPDAEISGPNMSPSFARSMNFSDKRAEFMMQ